MRASEALVIALILGGCACGSRPSLDAGLDGGVEAGVDATRDAGRDAARDAGRDAQGLDGGWDPVADVPSGCELYVASAELVAATPWAIEPCPDRSGCRRIAPIRDVPRGAVPFRVERGHGVHDGDRGLVVVFGDSGAYLDEWIIDDRGQSVAGLRTATVGMPGSGACYHALYDVSSSHYGFVLNRGVGDVVRQHLYRGQLGMPPAYVAELVEPFGGADFAQELRIDGLRTATWLASQRVQAIEPDGSFAVIAGTALDGCDAEVADVQGDAIYVDCAAGESTVYVHRPGGPLERLLPAGQITYGLDSDGSDMAWLQYMRGDGGVEIELWTSPHATRAADLRPRYVATLPRPTAPAPLPVDVRVGSGYAAVLELPSLLGVHRLSDGARAELSAPEGEEWNGFVHYVGPEEIAATSGVYTAPASDRALMFVRLDSLVFVR